MCWYCQYGVPERVQAIYDEAERNLGDASPLLFGPAHVVWEDDNYDDDTIKWCLDPENFRKYSSNISDSEAVIVRESLEKLLLIPEGERDPAPDDDTPPKRGTTLISNGKRITY